MGGLTCRSLWDVGRTADCTELGSKWKAEMTKGQSLSFALSGSKCQMPSTQQVLNKGFFSLKEL